MMSDWLMEIMRDADEIKLIALNLLIETPKWSYCYDFERYEIAV